MNASSAPLLTVHGLSRSIGARRLFDIGELVFPRATAIVLTGKNGAGKTTLLRMVAGLEPAPGATVHWTDDHAAARSAPLDPLPRELRERIAYLHQHPYLFRTSVRENIAYGLRVRGVARHEIVRRTDEALAWAGVAHLQDTAPEPRWTA